MFFCFILINYLNFCTELLIFRMCQSVCQSTTIQCYFELETEDTGTVIPHLPKMTHPIDRYLFNFLRLLRSSISFSQIFVPLLMNPNPLLFSIFGFTFVPRKFTLFHTTQSSRCLILYSERHVVDVIDPVV